MTLKNQVVTIYDEVSFTYAQKKTEKLVTAIHLVTDHLGDEEPITKHLKNESLRLLVELTDLAHDSHTNARLKGLHGRVRKVLSLLEVSSQCGYISDQNVRVLLSEYGELRAFLQSHGTQLQSPVFSKGSLSVPKEKAKSDQRAPKLEVGITSERPKKTNGTKHSERQSIIVDLVSRKGRVSIKDVSKHIPECSEKTVQRELLYLVDNGTLRKEGERRWSTYVLAQGQAGNTGEVLTN